MHPQLESVFDEAENRYLKPEELGVLSQYVSSLPDRLEAYRALRDQELEVMQQVADALVAAWPNEPQAHLERSIRHALLVLRYCAMGMLLEDEVFVRSRLQGWLKETMQAYASNTLDAALYQLLEQHLTRALAPAHMSLLQPMLTMAQGVLFERDEDVITASALGW